MFIQKTLKGEVSLYCWPPVWLVWNQLYDNWPFLFYFQNRLIQTSETGGQWYSDTSPFSIPWFILPRAKGQGLKTRPRFYHANLSLFADWVAAEFKKISWRISPLSAFHRRCEWFSKPGPPFLPPSTSRGPVPGEKCAARGTSGRCRELPAGCPVVSVIKLFSLSLKAHFHIRLCSPTFHSNVIWKGTIIV